ncbi:Lrp/AsnC family transcriptional regulator [Mycolicibacterium sp. P9-64]|nr:Lrp/AsnC family transcriptional regulator [Mycolicibacterium sp. P9-64]
MIDQLRIDGRRGFGDVVRIGELAVHLAIRVRGVPVAMVARQLAQMPEIKYVGSCSGPYDLITDAECSDLQHLSELLTDRVRPAVTEQVDPRERPNQEVGPERHDDQQQDQGLPTCRADTM